MKKKVALGTLAVLIAAPAHAIDNRSARQLQALAPDERREQRCDIEAMNRIAKEGNGFRPDKVIAYTFADPVEKGDRVKAPSADFRSRADWYRLKYRYENATQGLAKHISKLQVVARVPHEPAKDVMRGKEVFRQCRMVG